MIRSIDAFQFDGADISMQNKSLDRLIHKFKFDLIKNDQIFGRKLKMRTNESKIMIVDEIDSYLWAIFDYTVIFISDISILPKLVSNFDESILFTLSENIEKYFHDNFQNQVLKHEKFEKFSSICSSLSEHFELNPSKKEIITIWSLMRLSFSSYFVSKSYINNSNKKIKINQTEFNEEDFITLDNLGSGSSSTTNLVFHIESEEFFANKIFNNSTSFNREYNFYRKIQHHSIPYFYGRIKNKESLIIESIRSKTLDKIDYNKLTNENKFYIIMQLLIVLEYLHYNDFVYRDLKPNNLFVDENMKLILTDFDQVINLNEVDDATIVTSDFNSFYAAPELQNNIKNSKYTYEMDSYSVGILLNSIFNNKLPEIAQNDNVEEINNLQKYQQIKKICQKCTDEKPENRPPITKLFDYFFNFYYNKNPTETQTESIDSTEKDKIYPLWIRNELEFKSLFEMKFGPSKQIECIENYFQETNKIHLFKQYDLMHTHYIDKYFKENSDKFIRYLLLIKR